MEEFKIMFIDRQDIKVRTEDYCYNLEYCFQTIDNKRGKLEFRVVRIEYFKDETDQKQEFNKSTICEYILKFDPPLYPELDKQYVDNFGGLFSHISWRPQ